MIDSSVIQSFQLLDDTTVQVRFNKAWQGMLDAEIQTSCGLLRDSLKITVVPSPGSLNLGEDTAVCPGNSVLLNAKSGYASYRWNNGSTDSVLIVTAPGKYFADVQDACGNLFSDTVNVVAAPPIPFDIGPDRKKCDNDTLHLTAPGGFLNYSWTPAYDINTQTGQRVIVQPAADTIYFVKAEKTPGCFAYDTIRIKVNQSPPISLGADKNFCSGDSAILDAGAGFTQYQWSTGSSAQRIVVGTTGSYSVTAYTAEGCKSNDTLRVNNVWPNPVVSLNDNPDLCAGSTRILQPGSFISYLWQDGSTASTFAVTSRGTYYVTVIDNNQCKGSDTVRIVRYLPPPVNFLPADTSICNYGTMLLKASTNFINYKWSNNSTSPSITITSPGVYWLRVTDASNCTGKDSIVVKSKNCLNGFYIPNAFTPDNNGRNDFFKPFIGGVVKKYQFMIYNRWGQIIFTTNDQHKGWDGKLAGIDQDPNVFVWTCTYQIENQSVKKEKGTVVLMR